MSQEAHTWQSPRAKSWSEQRLGANPPGTSIASQVMGVQGDRKDKDYLPLWNVSSLLTPPYLDPHSLRCTLSCRKEKNGRSLEMSYP